MLPYGMSARNCQAPSLEGEKKDGKGGRVEGGGREGGGRVEVYTRICEYTIHYKNLAVYTYMQERLTRITINIMNM